MLAGAAVLTALAGCRDILGIHDEPTIQCLTNADCLGSQICSAGRCIEPDGSTADAASDDADRDAASADSADATLVDGGADAIADATLDAASEGASLSDAPGPPDTGADHTAPPVPDASSSDAADAAGIDAADVTVVDTGSDANDASAMDDGSCNLPPSGVCSQCAGSCTLHRDGFEIAQAGGVNVLDAHTFFAVQIAVPSPSWLLRLGIQTTINGAVGELALYEDSSGQPGAFVTKVDVTTLYDPATDGSEQSADCDALCIPLTQGNYWVGALFDRSINVLSDNASNATIYQADSPSPDGGTLADGVVPPGTVSSGLDRNIYIVVTH